MLLKGVEREFARTALPLRLQNRFRICPSPGLGVLFHTHVVELIGAVGFADALHESGGLLLLAIRLLARDFFRHANSVRALVELQARNALWSEDRAARLTAPFQING